jgi:hypothetical protein
LTAGDLLPGNDRINASELLCDRWRLAVAAADGVLCLAATARLAV